MEREVVLDTETTGQTPQDRIIEVAAVVIEGTRVTGASYHQFFDPEREVHPEAEKVHGWSRDKLRGFPPFRDKARELADFLGDMPIVAHNGKFDMRYLEAEFAAAGVRVRLGPLRDTLPMARRLFPGQSNTLDAICKRYQIDLTDRKLHGALVDVNLLHQAYVRLNGWDQLIPVSADEAPAQAAAASVSASPFARRAPRPASVASPDELARHAAFVSRLGDASKGVAPIWSRLGGGANGEV